MLKYLIFYLQLSVLLLQCSPTLAQSFYKQGFEEGMPQDFILINADGLIPAQEKDSLFEENAWIVIESELMSSRAAMSLSWYRNEEGPTDDWMVLPMMEIGSQAKMEWRAISTTFGEFPDSYEVLFAEETPSLENLSDIQINLILRIEAEEHSSPADREVSLADFEGKKGHIVFRNITASGDALLIDDIILSNVELLPTHIEKVASMDFDLQLFPNPSTSYSTLQYQLQKPSNVTLKLQNRTGQTVWELKQEKQNEGIYQLPLAAKTLPKGLYYLKLQIGDVYVVEKWVVE